MSLVAQGWAIRRNGSCLAGVEVDCGGTVESWRGCCPTGYACPTQYNIACCSPGQNCTSSISSPQLQQQRCANATWDLFNNGGAFCCEHGLAGYARSNTDGCAPPGMQFQEGDTILSTIRLGSQFVPTIYLEHLI